MKLYQTLTGLLTILSCTACGGSGPSAQFETSARHVRVDQNTLDALPPGATMHLSAAESVIYEFDGTGGPIDYDRILLPTPDGSMIGMEAYLAELPERPEAFLMVSDPSHLPELTEEDLETLQRTGELTKQIHQGEHTVANRWEYSGAYGRMQSAATCVPIGMKVYNFGLFMVVDIIYYCKHDA